jgi:hypothetical protein
MLYAVVYKPEHDLFLSKCNDSVAFFMYAKSAIAIVVFKSKHSVLRREIKHSHSF